LQVALRGERLIDENILPSEDQAISFVSTIEDQGFVFKG
jgi:hypothetical protein